MTGFESIGENLYSTIFLIIFTISSLYLLAYMNVKELTVRQENKKFNKKGNKDE